MHQQLLANPAANLSCLCAAVSNALGTGDTRGPQPPAVRQCHYVAFGGKAAAKAQAPAVRDLCRVVRLAAPSAARIAQTFEENRCRFAEDLHRLYREADRSWEQELYPG